MSLYKQKIIRELNRSEDSRQMDKVKNLSSSVYKEINPQTLSEIYYKSLEQMELVQYKAALTDLKKAISVDPFNIDALYKECFLLGELKRYEEGLRIAEKLLNIYSEDKKSLFFKFMYLLWIKSGKEALIMNKEVREIRDKLSKDIPYCIELWPHSSVYYAQAGQYRNSLNFLDRVLEMEPKNGKLWYYKGTIFFNKYKYQEALSYFDKAYKLDWETPKLYFSRGITLLKLNQYKNALLELNKAQNAGYNSTEIWHHKGNIFFFMEQYEDAEYAYNNVLAISPKSPLTLSNKAVLLQKLGLNHQILIAYMNSALELDSKNAEILYNKYKLLLKGKCSKEAKRTYTKALKINTQRINFLSSWDTEYVIFSLNELEIDTPKIITDDELFSDIVIKEKAEQLRIQKMKRLNYKSSSLYEMKDNYSLTIIQKQTVWPRLDRASLNGRANMTKAPPLLDRAPLNQNGSDPVNILSIAKDIVNEKTGLSFQEFFAKKLENVSPEKGLLMADDELLIYNYHQQNPNFIPNLKMIDGNYKKEYSKLESWFCDRFFNLLLARVSVDDPQIDERYYQEIKKDFVRFYYSISETNQYLNKDLGYSGIEEVNKMILFLKKSIRKIDISKIMDTSEIVDIAGNICIKGSALFFLELYSSLKRREILEKFQAVIDTLNNVERIKLTQEPFLLPFPWRHQREAFEAWMENKNSFIEMATATGKTLVGLMAIELLYRTKKNATVRVFAHSKAILNQWKRETIEKLGLIDYSRDSYAGSIRSLFCGGMTIHFNTLQMAYKEPESYSADLIIVDEVHHSAALKYSQALDAKSQWKMGLSATIEGERINILGNKLGPRAYCFSLEDAIKAKIVPKFEWKLHAVYLSVEENAEFYKLSRKIQQEFDSIKYDFSTINEIEPKTRYALENLHDFVKLIEKARF